MAKQDVYEIITNDIIARIEAGGTLPWRKPWNASAGMPRNAATGRAYNGINTLILWSIGHADPRYATFKQAQQFGGTVRKGSKGIRVVFWNMLEKTDKDTGETKTIPMLRYYTVFNVADIDGAVWKTDEPASEPTVWESDSVVERAHSVTVNMPNKPSIFHDANSAYYSPSSDEVHLPPIDTFHTPEGYAETYLHEVVHSTGHSDRLDRLSENEVPALFGSESYSREELVAEIGAAFLLAHAGIESADIRENNAAYVASWLNVLKGDSRAIIYAAGRAQKAADYITGGQ